MSDITWLVLVQTAWVPQQNLNGGVLKEIVWRAVYGEEQ